METFTRKEVEELLKIQRNNCYESARIETFEYNNPYSSSDGKVSTKINRKSIINAKSPLNDENTKFFI